MRDQATELRRLMLSSTQSDSKDADDAPRLVVVAGGKEGVGTTTMAVNLSVAMALNGLRVVLVDADLHQPAVSALCGLDKSGGDILTVRHDIHEIIQLGPAGLQIVPGLWPPGGTVDLSEMRQRHLIRQWRSLRRHADMVILDAGNGPSDALRRFWWAADDVVLTTTPDSLCVMECYATIKTMKPSDRETPIRLLVNNATGQDEASEAYQRLSASCRRFLQTDISLLGHVNIDSGVRKASLEGHPFVTSSLDSLAGRQIQNAAADLRALGNIADTRRHMAA